MRRLLETDQVHAAWGFEQQVAERGEIPHRVESFHREVQIRCLGGIPPRERTEQPDAANTVVPVQVTRQIHSGSPQRLGAQGRAFGCAFGLPFQETSHPTRGLVHPGLLLGDDRITRATPPAGFPEFLVGTRPRRAFLSLRDPI